MVHPAIPVSVAQPNLLNGLVAKRAEIAGRIEASRSYLARLKVELGALDATIQLFESRVDLSLVRPRPVPLNDRARSGEVTPFVIEQLRGVTEPVTAREIACDLLSWRCLDPSDEQLLRLTTRRVGACLRAKRTQGLVRSVRVGGAPLAWHLSDELISERSPALHGQETAPL